jgi:hypothetical protein
LARSAPILGERRDQPTPAISTHYFLVMPRRRVAASALCHKDN